MFLEIVIGYFSALHGAQAYSWLFLLMALCGIGAPVSQDMLLLAAGGLTLTGAMQSVPEVFVAAAGLLAGDLFTFWAGHHYGARWVRRPWAANFVAPDKLPAMEEGARRYALPACVLTRFLPGQRSTLFFVAGSLRMPYRPFLIGDGIAALLQAGLFTYGARALGWHWSALRERFDRTDDVLTALLVVAVFLLLWRARRR